MVKVVRSTPLSRKPLYFNGRLAFMAATRCGTPLEWNGPHAAVFASPSGVQELRLGFTLHLHLAHKALIRCQLLLYACILAWLHGIHSSGSHSNASCCPPLDIHNLQEYLSSHLSVVSVISRLFTVWWIGPQPTSLRGLGGLISEWPSPRWVCLKRLSEPHLPRLSVLNQNFSSLRWTCLKRLGGLNLPRFGIRVSLLLGGFAWKG